ncbi:MAG: hypothetical protein C4321_07710 [Chloroflexota bacterium]
MRCFLKTASCTQQVAVFNSCLRVSQCKSSPQVRFRSRKFTHSQMGKTEQARVLKRSNAQVSQGCDYRPVISRQKIA